MIFMYTKECGMMRATIQKWGNSLGIRLPKRMLDQLDLSQGSVLQCSMEDGCIKLIPIQRSRKEELEQLLSAITVDNLHHVDFFCDEVGGEAW